MMKRLLGEGDVILLKPGSKLYNCVGETTAKGGQYVVTDTAMTGGGTGHGPNDVYPDGHHVTLKRLRNGKWDADAMDVCFYQTGAFTIVKRKEKIRLVGQMKKSMEFIGV